VKPIAGTMSPQTVFIGEKKSSRPATTTDFNDLRVSLPALFPAATAEANIFSEDPVSMSA
jgi:hypothetical protein